LSTPPAFVLSQDQTHMFNPFPHPFPSAPQLAKASALPETSQAFTLSESDCSSLHSRVTLNLLYSLYRFQGSFAVARLSGDPLFSRQR
ncbi:MAG: hypothetical protein IJ466_01905, partial [Clostridia bacterium]|nr:hypothetical protein [Clostridia bacterium]